MSTEKEYEKAFKSWREQQENTIKQIEMNIQNSKNMIEVHTESLGILERSLKHEKELLKKAVENK